MRPSVFLALALLTLFTRAALSQDEMSPEERQVQSLTTYFYLDKDPSDAIKVLSITQDHGLLDDADSAYEPMVAFLATVFSENPAKIDSIAKSRKFEGRTKSLVQEALWLSGNVSHVKDIFGDVPAAFNDKPKELRKRSVRDAADLDRMWGAFLASGDTTYVKKIIAVLDKKHTLSGSSEEKAITREAAEWSLKSNMFQHELVFRTIKTQAEARRGEVRKKLKKLLSSLDQAPSLTNKDGEFSAMLLTMDEESMKEFRKPTDVPLKLDVIKTARRGDIIGIKIAFTGIALAEDLTADVVFDLKILDPDGEIYDETDLKDLEALKRRIPTRFRFFNNAETVMI